MEVVVGEHIVENGRDAAFVPTLNTKANRNCQTGIDLSAIAVRARPYELADKVAVRAIAFLT